MEAPGLGILVGALFTALVQSSSATTGVVIVLASQGFITLPAGIALAFGANIGTCVTAFLAALGKPREAARAAGVHVLFNVLGVLVWLAFIDHLAELVTWASPRSQELQGLDRLAAETPRQIANAHTVFNVANTLLFLPLAGVFAKVVERFIPDRPVVDGEARARYLDLELVQTPSLAVDRARLELLHMGDRVRTMLEGVLPAVFDGEKEDLEELRNMDEAVDLLHGQIVTYLGHRNEPGQPGFRASGDGGDGE
jgi:phosphate:Na+ symporter